jgi:biopolymer transport protein ExbB/TolQ
MDLLQQTYLGDILYIIVQALLLPAVIVLLALVLYALWCIGSIVVEWITERRYYRVVMPEFLDDIHAAVPEDLPALIADSGLLGSQKEALLTLWDYRNLPVDSHIALAKRLIEETEDHHMRVLQRTQTVAKVAPMLGLMGTLIPLGPGLVSLGQGNTLELSASLLVAFDTTVAGLMVAVVTFIVTKVRQRWYDNYLSALEAATTAVLEKVDKIREDGSLDTVAPTHYLQDLKAASRSARKAKSVAALAGTRA